MVNNSYLSGGGLLASCHKFFDSFLAWYGIRLYKIQKKKKKQPKKLSRRKQLHLSISGYVLNINYVLVKIYL